VNVADVPRTAEQVKAIHIRLEQLKDELQNAASRRSTVMGNMDDAPERALPGLEQRLNALDNRILGLEAEITRNNALLTQAPAEAIVGAAPQGPDPAVIVERLTNDIIPIVAIISTFVFAPIAFSIARFFWRRGSPAARVAAPDHATQQKLEHLQQAVDTIAIEIERISEGQRFVTRVLSDRTGASANPNARVESGR
jgi:FtsZ-binding cell division protein ZapB